MPESTRQREAFNRYWELGADRSISRLRDAMVAAGQGISLRTLYEWSRRYGWQERLAALEREARAAEDGARVRALRQMYERQAQEALLLQQKGAAALAGVDPDQLTPETGIRAIVEGARLERIARGEPTERWADYQKDDPDGHYEQFSDAELRELLALVEGDPRGAVAPSTRRPGAVDGDGAEAPGRADPPDPGDAGDLP